MVQTRIHQRLVALGQARLVDVLAAAQDLGDVVARQLDVDAASIDY